MSRRKHQRKLASRTRHNKLQLKATPLPPLSHQSDASTQTSPIASAPAPPAIEAFADPRPLLTQDSVENCDVHPVRPVHPVHFDHPAQHAHPAQPVQLVQMSDGNWAPVILMSAAATQMQMDLELACMNLDPFMVHHILEAGGEELMLGGLHHLHGNSPLQVAVDALFVHLEWLRTWYADERDYREDCRARFSAVMNLLLSRMASWEIRNINYDGDHALRKLAQGSCDWRLVNTIMAAMDYKSGEKCIVSYVHGGCNGPQADDPSVFGYLVEKLNNVGDGQEFYWYHPCGHFSL
jgi:hypothetical protein